MLQLNTAKMYEDALCREQWRVATSVQLVHVNAVYSPSRSKERNCRKLTAPEHPGTGCVLLLKN
jgi:hypothetical protein